MKKTKKYFTEERFRMMPMPQWYQLFKWISYLWRRRRYKLWKKRGELFLRCPICGIANRKKVQSCNNCKTTFTTWEIQRISTTYFERLLKDTQIRQLPFFLKNKDKTLERELNQRFTDFEKQNRISTVSIFEKTRKSLLLQFSKFPTIAKNAIENYQRENSHN